MVFAFWKNMSFVTTYLHHSRNFPEDTASQDKARGQPTTPPPHFYHEQNHTKIFLHLSGMDDSKQTATITLTPKYTDFTCDQQSESTHRENLLMARMGTLAPDSSSSKPIRLFSRYFMSTPRLRTCRKGTITPAQQLICIPSNTLALPPPLLYMHGHSVWVYIIGQYLHTCSRYVSKLRESVEMPIVCSVPFFKTKQRMVIQKYFLLTTRTTDC